MLLRLIAYANTIDRQKEAPKIGTHDAAQREEIERLRDRLKETMEMCHDAISRRVSIQEQAKYGARMGAIRAEEF